MTLLLVIVIWKLLWALLSNTWYVPDETWQSVEVAHQRVWDRGHLTWEHQEAIRSALLSLPYTIIFSLLSILHLDYQWLVILLPKIFAGLLTAIGDYCFYKLVKIREGRGCAAWVLLLTQTNWFLMYSGSRTLVNTAEMALLSIGLSQYPRPSYLPVAALSVMMRPTIVIAWLPLLLKHLYSVLIFKGLVNLIKLSITPLMTVLVTIVIDTLHYGHWTLTPLNFFKFNVVHNLGSFYGTNPCYWYITNTLLPIMGPFLPVSLIYFVQDNSNNDIIKGPVICSVLFLSMLEHKEMRFLQPILPLLFYSVAKKLHRWTQSAPTSLVFSVLMLFNMPIAVYLSMVHQRGVVDVSVWLGQQTNVSSAMFLMPCHSAPMHSHVHRPNINLSYLQCLPNIHNDPHYVEEAEAFYSSPAEKYLTLYSHNNCLIIFDSMMSSLMDSFERTGHIFVKSFFHTHFSNGRIGENVQVFCKDR